MNKCYVKVYYDWIEQTAALSDAERGRLFIAILEYARSGLDPKLDGRESILFPVFRATIDRDNKRAATNAQNGALGGRGNKATESNQKQNEASESEQKATKDIRQRTKDKGHKTQDKDEEYICAETESASTPPVMTLPLNDGALFPVEEDDISKWSALYPAVDILAELRKMAGWLDANPTRRKTKAGIRRFVNGWLAKEQDRGGSAPAPTYQSKAAERNAQYCQHDAPLSPLEKKAVERALAKEAYDERP